MQKERKICVKSQKKGAVKTAPFIKVFIISSERTSDSPALLQPE